MVPGFQIPHKSAGEAAEAKTSTKEFSCDMKPVEVDNSVG